MSINNNDNGNIRKNIIIGSEVRIVEKRNQRSGKLSDGKVKRILTSSLNHHHGIKVMLTNGKIGRVKEIISSNSES